MKICRVLLGAVFTFITIECQASTKSSLTTTDIFEDASGGFLYTSLGSTPARVKGEGFRNTQDFDIATTRLLSKDQKKTFVKHLFTSNEQNTFFTYALLEIASRGDHESGKYETQSRATAILGAIQANADMNNAFASNRNKVIILNRLQSSLDVVPFTRKSSFSGTSPVKSPTKPSATSAILRFTADDITVIENRLGVDFNAKKNAASEESKVSAAGTPIIVPVKSVEQLEQEAIDSRWGDFLTSYYATDLASKVGDVLDFTSGMTASAFLIKPTTLVEAEERIRAATEHYQQELFTKIGEVRFLRTQV